MASREVKISIMDLPQVKEIVATSNEIADRLATAMAHLQELLDPEPSADTRAKAELFVQETANWLGMDSPPD